MIGHPCRHCWRDAKGAVNADKVIMLIMERDRMRVILHLLAERVRQSRESAHRHPHSQILALDITRGNVLWVWIASAAEGFRSMDLRRTVPARRMRNLAVHFDELRVIDIRA